ncbi:hypothetical protein BpHYR1_046699 [Brachionus plicatilis]|uniref:Uncharacterized protein n=1 Tax=Brachionus plicatilis TaxID=10195 RepID=A0A3M7S2S9_BRAPC|nr:hypothetical protein BpHYR1_046699 [Brachionus plicatilis]
MDPGGACCCSSLLADSVDLVKDDYVKTTVWAESFLFLFSLGKQFANIGLGLAHILVQYLRSIHYFWLSGIQHFANLSRHQRLASARRPE